MIEHLSDYAKYGRAAPLVRNRLIIDDCDKVLAFWDGKSRGTKQSLDYAERKGKLIRIIEINR